MKRWQGVLAVAMVAVTGCVTIPKIRTSDDMHQWRRVRDTQRRLIAAASTAFDITQFDWQFGVVDGESIGAASLPDGRIGIDATFARELSDDELAAVMSHEVMHVLHGHGMKKVAWTLGGGLVTIGGTVAGFIVFPFWGGCLTLLGLETARELTVVGFSRAQEYDADEYGLWLLVAAGYRSDAMIRMLEHVDQHFRDLGIPNTALLSDQPSISDRQAHIKELQQHYQYP